MIKLERDFVIILGEIVCECLIWCNWLNLGKTCGPYGDRIELSDSLKRNTFCEILDFSQIRC